MTYKAEGEGSRKLNAGPSVGRFTVNSSSLIVQGVPLSTNRNDGSSFEAIDPFIC